MHFSGIMWHNFVIDIKIPVAKHTQSQKASSNQVTLIYL